MNLRSVLAFSLGCYQIPQTFLVIHLQGGSVHFCNCCSLSKSRLVLLDLLATQRTPNRSDFALVLLISASITCSALTCFLPPQHSYFLLKEMLAAHEADTVTAIQTCTEPCQKLFFQLRDFFRLYLFLLFAALSTCLIQ